MNVSKSELQVLEKLWTESPLTVGQVIERVQTDVDWHENTVKTLLARLLKKRLVRRRRDGGRFFYSPAIAREEVVLSEAENLLERFFGGRIDHLVAHFADSRKLSAEDVRAMEAVLERLKKEFDD